MSNQNTTVPLEVTLEVTYNGNGYQIAKASVYDCYSERFTDLPNPNDLFSDIIADRMNPWVEIENRMERYEEKKP